MCTDIEGVGTSWSVNSYAQVRSVVDALQDLKLPARTIEQVASGNYARVLKAALSSRRGPGTMPTLETTTRRPLNDESRSRRDSQVHRRHRNLVARAGFEPATFGL